MKLHKPASTPPPPSQPDPSLLALAAGTGCWHWLVLALLAANGGPSSGAEDIPAASFSDLSPLN